MTKNEYELARKYEPDIPTIRVADLENKTPRTLLYGYTCDRNTFHVYLSAKGNLVRYVYKTTNVDHTRTPAVHSHALIELPTLINDELAAVTLSPNKRVYSQFTDLDFFVLLRKCGVSVTLLAWEAPNREGPYYGEILPEAKEIRNADPHDT